jgi:hypothetical protein
MNIPQIDFRHETDDQLDAMARKLLGFLLLDLYQLQKDNVVLLLDIVLTEQTERAMRRWTEQEKMLVGLADLGVT